MFFSNDHSYVHFVFDKRKLLNLNHTNFIFVEMVMHFAVYITSKSHRYEIKAYIICSHLSWRIYYIRDYSN